MDLITFIRLLTERAYLVPSPGGSRAVLLIAEGFNRVKVRRLARRIIAEEHADTG